MPEFSLRKYRLTLFLGWGMCGLNIKSIVMTVTMKSTSKIELGDSRQATPPRYRLAVTRCLESPNCAVGGLNGKA